MLAALLCGAVVFPGLFLGLRKALRLTRTRWSDADVVSVSERSAAPTPACAAPGSGQKGASSVLFCLATN